MQMIQPILNQRYYRAVAGLTDTAVLLAGGKSSRLGQDKKTILVDGQPLVEVVMKQLGEIFPKIIVVDNSGYEYGPNCQKVRDSITGSALAGLYSGLSHCQAEYAFVLACDMPFLNPDYVCYQARVLQQSGKQAVVTAYEEWGEPLHAFYRKDLLVPLAECLLAGQKSIFRFAKQEADSLLVPETVARGFSPDWRMFFNINTPQEWEEYLILRRLTADQAN